MKDAMNIDVPIASFKSDSLAMRSASLAVSLEKQLQN